MTLSTWMRTGSRMRVSYPEERRRAWMALAITRTSPKGRQNRRAGHVALTFYCNRSAGKVRIRGLASDMGSETSAADFLARPQGSEPGLCRTPELRLGRRRRGGGGLRQQLSASSGNRMWCTGMEPSCGPMRRL